MRKVIYWYFLETANSPPEKIIKKEEFKCVYSAPMSPNKDPMMYFLSRTVETSKNIICSICSRICYQRVKINQYRV